MIVLSNASTLYDGTSGTTAAVQQRVDVHVDRGRIALVRPHSADEPGQGATRVDCSGLTLTPGLIDCHGHAALSGLRSADVARAAGPEGLLLVEKALHRTLVEGGVTTYRDVGGVTHLVKRLVEQGSLIGPRLKIAICVLSTTSGHADFRGTDRCAGDTSLLFPPGPGRPSSLVDGPWDCRLRVRELAGCGADLIKICTSPGVASPSDHLEHDDFTAEEVAALCSEAAARGLPVAAHAHGRRGIELGLLHGVIDIQHASFFDEPLAELALAKGARITPTSWVIQELLRAEGLSPFVMEKAKRVADAHARAVEVARAAGVPILAGTDPVLPGMHGRNYMEIAALVAEGLNPLEAWHSMTGLAARGIGHADTGTLVPGQRADILACRGDVLNDATLLDRGALVEVLKDGVGYRGGLPGVPQRTFRDLTAGMWGDGANTAEPTPTS